MAGSEGFRQSRAGWLSLGVFLWLIGTAFPRCGGVRVRSWLQEGGEWGKWFGLLHSPSTHGAVPKCRSAGLGVCTAGFSLFVNQALHQSWKEFPLVWRGWAGSSCMVLFTTLFHHAPEHLCSCLSTSCDHLSVGTRVTFFTNCSNVRLLNNSV